MAHPVTLDRLDLDDLGAEIAQHLGRERSLGELGEVGDDEPCQWSGHDRGFSSAYPLKRGDSNPPSTR
jgi:hypothetical protein